jgi:hypothetical protein
VSGWNREQRIARNERLLREHNWEVYREALEPAPGASDQDTELVLLCACGRESCKADLLVTIAEYRAAHETPHRFIVAPGHVSPEMERVIERHERYWVVEKLPAFRAP